MLALGLVFAGIQPLSAAPLALRLVIPFPQEEVTSDAMVRELSDELYASATDRAAKAVVQKFRALPTDDTLKVLHVALARSDRFSKAVQMEILENFREYIAEGSRPIREHSLNILELCAKDQLQLLGEPILKVFIGASSRRADEAQPYAQRLYALLFEQREPKGSCLRIAAPPQDSPPPTNQSVQKLATSRVYSAQSNPGPPFASLMGVQFLR